MLALSLFCSTLAFGQSGADLIPDDASFAFVINDVGGLRDKGEKFVKDHGLRVSDPKPSTLFNNLFDYLGVRKGLDEKGAAALVMPNLKKLEVEEISFDVTLLAYIYLVIPVKDVGEMAANFKLKADDLKDGKMHEARGKVIQLKGKHLYMAYRKDALSLLAKSKPLTGALGAQQKAAITKSDLAIHLGAEALGVIFSKQLDELEKNLRRKDALDDSQSKALIDALRQTRFVVAGLSLEGGGKINAVATFREGKDGEAAKKFLAALRAGPGASDLAGLPTAAPWLVFAAKGDGATNVAMTRALVNMLFDQGKIDALLPGKERPAFIAALERMYKELKGSRIALYDTGDATKRGRFALVGILDIGDTEKHLGEMPSVVKHLNKAAENAAKGTDRKAPVFTYEGKAEKIDGVRVDVIGVRIPDLKEAEKKELEAAFGPDWGRIRVAVEDRKVMFLAGSHLGLLREALTNVKKGGKGLAADKMVTGELARLSKERKLEVHVNLRNIARYRAGKKAEPVQGLTSIALTVEEDRVQLEVVASASEIKPFAALLGLADTE